MNTQQLHILIVDDSQDDALLIARILRRGGYALSYERVDTAAAMWSALEAGGWDLVIADYAMPSFTGLDALHILQTSEHDIPLILVSGTIGEEVAVAAVKAGASDYVMKDNLTRLAPAVGRELEEARIRRARRRAEEQLRKLSRAVEQSPVSVIITDTQGVVDYVNPRFSQMSGYAAVEVVGHTISLLQARPGPLTAAIPDNAAGGFYDQLRAILLAGREWSGEMQHRRKNGEWYWVAVSISPLYNTEGEITHFITVEEDITERKHQEAAEEQRARELARALEQQRELDRLRDEFIQNVSHELRTPMAIARGYIELLESGELGPLLESQREPVSIVARRLRMLSHLVDDINAILELQKQEPHFEVLDLAHLVRDVFSEYRAPAEQAGIEVRAAVPAAELPLRGDAIQLRRVLDNLFSNALKFTPAGGRISLSLCKDHDHVLLTVADTGIGIAPDEQERIFERFYQVDGSMSRRYGGFGLGLALVKQIVEMHGGAVSVESAPGEGSAFHVNLPLQQATGDQLL